MSNLETELRYLVIESTGTVIAAFRGAEEAAEYTRRRNESGAPHKYFSYDNIRAEAWTLEQDADI